MWNFLWGAIKPYVLKTLTGIIGGVVTGFLIAHNISPNGSAVDIIGGLIALIIGGGAIISAHNQSPPNKPNQ